MFWRDWMLVILMEEQILATKQVCPSCLLADRSGQPRWSQGRLRCPGAIRKLSAKPEQNNSIFFAINRRSPSWQCQNLAQSQS